MSTDLATVMTSFDGNEDDHIDLQRPLQQAVLGMESLASDLSDMSFVTPSLQSRTRLRQIPNAEPPRVQKDLSKALKLLTDPKSAKSPEAAEQLLALLEEKGADSEAMLEVVGEKVFKEVYPFLKEWKVDMLLCLLGLSRV